MRREITDENKAIYKARMDDIIERATNLVIQTEYDFRHGVIDEQQRRDQIIGIRLDATDWLRRNANIYLDVALT